MIFLLDEPYSETSHSRYLIDIIHQHTNEVIEIVDLPSSSTKKFIANKIFDLLSKVRPNDIVLCAWAIKADENLDELFSELGECCRVVVSAGNFHEPLENYTPARSDNVIVVGTLNKSGLVAALSNYSESKHIVWIPGTNYDSGQKVMSGTSVSAALYAAFLSKALKNGDIKLLDDYITEYANMVFKEINSL